MVRKLALSTILSCLLAITVLAIVVHKRGERISELEDTLEKTRLELAQAKQVTTRFIEAANKIEVIGRETNEAIESVRHIESDWLNEPVDSCVYETLCRVAGCAAPND